MGGIYPMFGWGLHFLPFAIMGRVTYVHHYVPALYFAMLVFCYEVESFSSRLNKPNASPVLKLLYLAIYIGLLFSGWYFLVFQIFVLGYGRTKRRLETFEIIGILESF